MMAHPGAATPKGRMANKDDNHKPTEDNPAAYASRSSRIFTMARTNPFLPVSLVLIVGSVVLPFAVFRVIYLVLGAMLTGVLVHFYRPRIFPIWFRRMADYYIAQLQENPIESIGLLGIFAFSMLNRIIWPLTDTFTNFREGTSCILLLLAFGLYGHKPAGRRQPIWELFRKRRHRKPAIELEEERKIKTTPPGGEPEDLTPENPKSEHDAWHLKQSERWESWIKEETDRLDGDKKK